MNEQSIKEHYKLLAHSCCTEIRIFSPQQEGSKYSFYVTSEDEFVKTILSISPEHSIGVGINERKPDCNTDEDVIELKTLVVDIDSIDYVKTFEDFIQSINLVPYAKIFSGQKGFHFYFKVVPIKNIVEIRNFLENAKFFFAKTHKLEIDIKCFNPSHIFRVWGTFNKGSEVKIIYINRDAPSINEKYFPERPYYEKVERKFLGKQQIIPQIKFIEDFLNGKFQLPIKENTSFNSTFIPNVVAYAKAKNLPLKRLFDTAIQKGHSFTEVDGWVKKSDKLIFYYPHLRGNIKENYEELYKQYFLKETLEYTNNLAYSQDGEATQSSYKELYRNNDFFTIAPIHNIRGKIIVQPLYIEQLYIGIRYEMLEDMKPFIIYYDEFVNIYQSQPLKEKVVKELDLGKNYRLLKTNMYIYDVITENNRIYKVYSEQKIENGDYVFYGTNFDISDKTQNFKTTKQRVDAHVLFLHSYENNKKIFQTFDECYKAVPHNIDDFYLYLMTKNKETYLTSEFFKKLYLSWFFAGKDSDGRPLNLMVIGAPGSGKTPQIHSINSKFGENESSGTKLTMNGLIISFFGNTPKPGEFIKANRVICIDEFFKILQNRTLVSFEDLTNLNDMLDNQKINVPNGKIDVEIQSKCQLLSCSNIFHERNLRSNTIGKRLSFMRMCEQLPSDFMGRIVFAIQSKDEYAKVKSREMLLRNYKNVDISKDLFLALYDFFQNIKIELSNEQEQKIFSICESITMPDVCKPVYDKSISRNASLIFYGIVKMRMFATKCQSTEVVSDDFVEFEKLWKELHYRWFTEEDRKENPIQFLTENEIIILKQLQDEKEISYYLADKNNMTQTLEKLSTMDIIEKDTVNRMYKIKPEEFFRDERI